MMDAAGQGGSFLGWKRYVLLEAVMRAYSEREHSSVVTSSKRAGSIELLGT